MKMTQQRKELHNYKLRIRAIAKLWVKWNRREISGNDFAYGIEKILRKETQQAWGKSIGIMNDKLFPKEVKNLEDLLV